MNISEALQTIVEIEQKLDALKRQFRGEALEEAKNASEVIVIVAAAFSMSSRDILGNSKIAEVVRARHIAMWICCQLWPTMTMGEIDRRFQKTNVAKAAIDAITNERAVSIYPGTIECTDRLLARCRGKEPPQLQLFKPLHESR